MIQRMPAFADEVLWKLASGVHPQVWLYGNTPLGWERAFATRESSGCGTAMVICDDPAMYVWPPLLCLAVDVNTVPVAWPRLHLLGCALVRAGAYGLWLIDFAKVESRFMGADQFEVRWFERMLG